ncbi:hypothetical protein KUCAC02_021859, partial [Chaenocephalus aceratus]
AFCTTCLHIFEDQDGNVFPLYLNAGEEKTADGLREKGAAYPTGCSGSVRPAERHQTRAQTLRTER